MLNEIIKQKSMIPISATRQLFVTRGKGERIGSKYCHLYPLSEHKGTDDITQF